MIASRLCFESVATGRPRAAVRGDPMAELRIGTHKTAARVGGNPIVTILFAIEHVTHEFAP